jgi:hypothetical protein
MTRASESGHIRNVSNFESLLSGIATFGNDYRPSKAGLKPEALKELLAAARLVLMAANQARSEYIAAVDVRKTAFASMGKYVTRIINALKASDSSVEADKTAMILVRKLRGERVSAFLSATEMAVLEAGGKMVRQHSSSQMNFDSRLDNFDKLVYLLETIPEYSPNEPELKVEALKAYYYDLKAKNSEVIVAESKKKSACRRRSELLYTPLTGLVDLAIDAKAYVKSVTGSTDYRYLQIAKLRFKNLKD